MTAELKMGVGKAPVNDIKGAARSGSNTEVLFRLRNRRAERACEVLNGRAVICRSGRNDFHFSFYIFVWSIL
jgi:hypothetical protein